MSDIDLDEEQLFDLLGNERRRACLKYLYSARREGRASVDARELARHVTEAVAEEAPPAEGLEKSVYTTLCQTHLPRLDRHGAVEYDEATKRVTTGPRFEEVCGHLEESTRLTGVGMGAVYLVVSLVSVLLIGGDLLVPSEIGVGQIAVVLLNLGFVGVLVARYTGRL